MSLAIGILAGLAAAFLVGADWRGLAEVRWRLAWLCLLGLGIQLVLFSRNEALVAPLAPYGPELHVLSFLLVLVSLVANWRTRGVPLIVLGAVSNLLVISLNGGQMPRVTPPEPAPFRNVAPTDENTRLAILSDWIHIPYLPGREFSLGDLLIATGGGAVAYGAARARRADRSPPVVLGRPQT